MATGRACRVSLKPYINACLVKEMVTVKNRAKRLSLCHMILTDRTLVLLSLPCSLQMSRMGDDFGSEAYRT
jgi:hypothetical protein